jgi:ribosome-associated protein
MATSSRSLSRKAASKRTPKQASSSPKRAPADKKSGRPGKGPRNGPGKRPGKGPGKGPGKRLAHRSGKRLATGLSIGKASGHAKVARSSALVALEKIALGALADMKAVNVKVLDVRGLTDVADTMIVCSGTSDRHVRAIAELVIERTKAAGRRPMGTEGKQDAEWVLVDLQDVLVHVMLPRVREFYALEQLWEAPAAARRGALTGTRPRSG